MIIPDKTHIILIIAAAIIAYYYPENISSMVIGSICVSIPLFIIAYITKGIGYGDVKLMFSAGLLFGYQAIIFIFVIGSIIASIYGIYQMRIKKANGKSEMSLGPHLILAIYLYISFGNNLISWYISSFF
jgi:leader peptidase (prepilin peptidase)/N-methyltransferase